MATHPENTLPGFLHAMACGADGVELDVVASGGMLYVTHDPLPELPLPTLLNTLGEVLALPAPDHFWFDVEAKSAPARLLSEAIRRSPVRPRVLVRSFDHEFLRAFHEIEPEIPLAALISYQSDDWVAIARAAKAAIVSPHYSTVTGERVARAHGSGIHVSVWTVNHPADWDRFGKMGVDAIVTDDPAAAVRYFKLFLGSG